MKYIYIINGPNLNMLGRRQTEIYGTCSLSQIEESCSDYLENHRPYQGQYQLRFLQSNSEGEIIDIIQQACDDGAAIIINPAAYSHNSIAILDALLIFPQLVVEVHLSNIKQREEFRHISLTAKRADAVIMGMGGKGYIYALDYVLRSLIS